MMWTVRDFAAADAPDLLLLMRELAAFEGYLDVFEVTERDLVERGLGPNPQFRAKVAGGKPGEPLLGMAVVYFIPYTATLRPACVLKELFVREQARSLGVGQALLGAVASAALEQGATSLRWTVLADNEPAQRFYAREGGHHDAAWQPWAMGARELEILASRSTVAGRTEGVAA